jgi:hypothetical protein
MLLSLKSIIVVTLAAFDLAAATLEEDQKKQCTFSCLKPGRSEGGCAKVTQWEGRHPVKWESERTAFAFLRFDLITQRHESGSWQLFYVSRLFKSTVVKAYSTENHKDFYNCLGTNMAFSTCCVPGSIKIPSKGKVSVIDSLWLWTFTLIHNINNMAAKSTLNSF